MRKRDSPSQRQPMAGGHAGKGLPSWASLKSATCSRLPVFQFPSIRQSLTPHVHLGLASTLCQIDSCLGALGGVRDQSRTLGRAPSVTSALTTMGTTTRRCPPAKRLCKASRCQRPLLSLLGGFFVCVHHSTWQVDPRRPTCQITFPIPSCHPPSSLTRYGPGAGGLVSCLDDACRIRAPPRLRLRPRRRLNGSCLGSLFPSSTPGFIPTYTPYLFVPNYPFPFFPCLYSVKLDCML